MDFCCRATSSSPSATTIFLSSADLRTKSLRDNLCRSALLCIRSYSSSVQRIVIVRLRFLIVSPSFVRFLTGGSGGLPDQQAFGGLPNAMLAFHTSVACTAQSAVVFSLCQCRHTRSTLRHNRFHRRRWDNYPISVLVAKTGVFVRDSNSAVTINLPSPEFYCHPNFQRYIDVCKVRVTA